MNSSSSANTQPSATSGPQRVKQFFKGVVVIFFAALLAVLVWFGFAQWQHYSRVLVDWGSRLDHVQQSISEHTRKNAKLAADMQVQSERYRSLIQRTAELEVRADSQAQRLIETAGSSRTDLLLAEGAYLARLASQRLYIERGTKNALALMMSIDTIFMALDHSQFLSVREALAADISRLKMVEETDIDGVFMALKVLSDQVQELEGWPSPTTREMQDQEPIQATVQSGKPSMLNATPSVLAAVSEKFFSLIRIERRNTSLPLLLDRRQELQARSAISGLVLQAQTALLLQQEGIYRTSLLEAAKAVQTFFSLNPIAQKLSQELSELARVSVVQNLPSLDRSRNAIDEVLMLRRQRSTVSEIEQ